MTSADAELIAACDRIVANDREQLAVYAVRRSVADERRTRHILDALFAEVESLMDRIDNLPRPTTLAGVIAMARAARAIATKAPDGQPVPPCDDEGWLAFEVMHALAEGVLA